jgi:hypothetical protein
MVEAVVAIVVDVAGARPPTSRGRDLVVGLVLRGGAGVAASGAGIVAGDGASGPCRAFFFVFTGWEADGAPVPAAGPPDPGDAMLDAESDTAPPCTVDELDALLGDDPEPDCCGELPEGSAQAIPEPEMTAAPIPNAAASPPIRPI